MTSVYTFRQTNTNTNAANNMQQNSNTNSGNLGSVEIPKLDFNEINFPQLGAGKTNGLAAKVELTPSPQPSCWGNKAVMETVKIPFPVQPVAPKNMIPPLFNKVRKNKKQTYEEEESDSEDEYEEYEEYEEAVSDSDDDF
jgi:hypothetical protein